MYYVARVLDTPSSIPAVVGDVLHNLRSALRSPFSTDSSLSASEPYLSIPGTLDSLPPIADKHRLLLTAGPCLIRWIWVPKIRAAPLVRRAGFRERGLGRRINVGIDPQIRAVIVREACTGSLP